MNGAYKARSVIASAQRCVNLYPEINQREAFMYMPQQTAPTILTHYPTPGLKLLATAPSGPIRGLYRANDNNLYCCAGSTIYRVDSNFGLTALGSIAFANTPVVMADNGTDIMIVDASANGYTVHMSSGAFAKITDAAFYGGTRVDYLDTFFVLNRTGFPTWYCSRSNATTFDPLYFASKTGYADNTMSIVVCSRQIWLIGQLTTEVWYDAGNPDFPFSPVPGAFIQHGTIATYSVASSDVNVFWLTEDLQGRAMVLQGSGYQAERISTHAIEGEWSSYSTIADAIGFCYQQAGHTFYVLTFPTADKTWVYDVSTQLWHERAWIDDNGVEHRHRAMCHAYCYEKNIVGDWENGNIYELDLNTYTDNGQPIRRIRTFPHLLNELKRVSYHKFTADMQLGTLDDTTSNEPTMQLRWSDTRGASWNNPISQVMGVQGEYSRIAQFRRLGMARDRVFEISWSVPTLTALNGASIDIEQCES